MYGLIILAGITVALCGRAQSCSSTLVDVSILGTAEIRFLYTDNISCTNDDSKHYVNKFINISLNITEQLRYIKDNEVFNFNRNVSFNDRNVNDTG